MRLHRLAARLPFFYGWVIVAVAGLGMFATGPAQTFTVAVFVDPMRNELGLSGTVFSAAYSLATLAAAPGLAVVGRVIDRFGARGSLIGAGLLLGLACFGMSQVHGLVGLALAFVALRLLGPGALVLASSIVAVHWFTRSSGRALGLVALGLAASSAVVPPVARYAVGLFDWRTAWLLLGVIVWVLLLAPAVVLVRDRPEDVGLKTYGGGESSAAPIEADTAPQTHWTAAQAVRTRAFWLLLLAMATPPLVGTGLTFHQVSYLVANGLEELVAPVFVAYGLASAAGMLAAGSLLDRVEPRVVVFGLLGLLLASVVALLATPAIAPIALVYGLLLGAAGGGMITAGGVVWARYYGRRHLGSIRGIESTVRLTAAALGPLPPALALDLLGSYTLGFVGFAVLAALAALAALGARRSRRGLASLAWNSPVP